MKARVMASCWRQLDGGKIMVKNRVSVAFIRSANWVWVWVVKT